MMDSQLATVTSVESPVDHHKIHNNKNQKEKRGISSSSVKSIVPTSILNTNYNNNNNNHIYNNNNIILQPLRNNDTDNSQKTSDSFDTSTYVWKMKTLTTGDFDQPSNYWRDIHPIYRSVCNVTMHDPDIILQRAFNEDRFDPAQKSGPWTDIHYFINRLLRSCGANGTHLSQVGNILYGAEFASTTVRYDIYQDQHNYPYDWKKPDFSNLLAVCEWV
jgi:hypothetical protein